MVKLKAFEDISWLTIDDQKFLLFGIESYSMSVKKWLSHLFRATQVTQLKQLLLIHGAVKSGKTTLIRYGLPHLLQKLRDDLKEFHDRPFCFEYIDLSALAKEATPEEKWRTFWSLLDQKFPGFLKPVDPNKVVRWSTTVKDALQSLKHHDANALWFISLDEFHNIFLGLSEDQIVNMAETAKHILLDDQSPCHFLLGGSTQATFWAAVGKAKDNGLRLLHEAHIITTPFEVLDSVIDMCCVALVAELKVAREVVDEAKATLPPSPLTPVNLSQVQVMPFLLNLTITIGSGVVWRIRERL